MNSPILRLLVILLACSTTFRLTAANFDVKSYGATGDGKTIDTPAINRAIDAARVVPEYEDNVRYPEPYRLGKLSSWGLFARHMKNFSADRAKLTNSAGAPKFVLKNVTGFAVTNSTASPTRSAPKKPENRG